MDGSLKEYSSSRSKSLWPLLNLDISTALRQGTKLEVSCIRFGPESHFNLGPRSFLSQVFNRQIKKDIYIYIFTSRKCIDTEISLE